MRPTAHHAVVTSFKQLSFLAGVWALTAPWITAAAPRGCERALAELAAAEDAVAASAAGSTAPRADPATVARHLYPWRQRVANACLGASLDPNGAERVAPSAMPGLDPLAHRATVRPPPMPPAAAPIGAPPPVVPLPSAPVTLGACGPAGCQASDGTVLQRLGSQWVGPRGICAVHGVFVVCP